jgi:Zn-dependent protease
LDEQVFIVAVFSYVIFLFSTVCHEAGHALAAKLGGDLTAYHNGQVSLSPVPHIMQEPIGLGVVPLVSLFISLQSGGLGVIGFASAPFDPHWSMRHPKRAAWMAMAGPAANFILAAIGIAAIKIGVALGAFHLSSQAFYWRLVEAPGSSVAEGLAVFFSVLFFENMLLGVWNLLPIPPMDGFSAALFFLPERKIISFFEIRQQIGMFYPMVMIALSSVFWMIFDPILGFVTMALLF